MDIIHELYHSFVLLIIFTSNNINGTSISTPTVVANATGLPIPYNAIAIATASSKKFDAPTIEAGAAMFCGIFNSFALMYAIVNTKNICMANGIAISTISCGLDSIKFPWKEKIKINVNSNPIVVILLNFGIKVFSR